MDKLFSIRDSITRRKYWKSKEIINTYSPKLRWLAMDIYRAVDIYFSPRWLASLEVISQVLFSSEQPDKHKMAFVGKLSQMKLLFNL